MEYLDLYDENKNLTGEKIIRDNGKPNVPDGRYINIVIIFIQNFKGQFLMQMTSKEKNNEWATTGGHVKSGQTSEEAIILEVYEELGLDISKEKIKLIDSSIFGIAFMDVYYMKKDIDIKELKLQKEEVSSVSWLSIEQINQLIHSGNLRKGNIMGFEKLKNLLKNNEIIL